MQTLEIRVEQKGIFGETDNEFSKARQIEVSFPKSKREKKSKKKISEFSSVDCIVYVCKVSSIWLEENAEIRRDRSNTWNPDYWISTPKIGWTLLASSNTLSLLGCGLHARKPWNIAYTYLKIWCFYMSHKTSNNLGFESSSKAILVVDH